ncbi:M23 family peptidase, partial [Halobacillus trueperi]
GRYHKGIDIAGVSDKTIKAADNGKVVDAGYRNSFGNKVVIDHGNGYETTYAHLSSIDVKKGETVKKGEKLGVMGTTGRSTGVHL